MIDTPIFIFGKNELKHVTKTKKNHTYRAKRASKKLRSLFAMPFFRLWVRHNDFLLVAFESHHMVFVVFWSVSHIIKQNHFALLQFNLNSKHTQKKNKKWSLEKFLCNNFKLHYLIRLCIWCWKRIVLLLPHQKTITAWKITDAALLWSNVLRTGFFFCFRVAFLGFEWNSFVKKGLHWFYHYVWLS